MRRKYSNETKAAVMAALLAGQSLGSIAKEYNMPKSTVSLWKNGKVQTNCTQKKEIGELLVKYLETNLEALRAQAEAFKNLRWLEKQNAADAAVLHGVMTDKAVRLLEAFGNATPDNTTES